MSLAAVLSNVGKYAVLLSAHARALWAISQPFMLDDVGGAEDSLGVGAGELETVRSNIAFEDHYFGRRIAIGICPQRVLGDDSASAPIKAVLLTTLLNALLIAFSFRVLVEVAVALLSLSLLLKTASFLKMRHRDTAPLLARPFRACRGSALCAYVMALSQVCAALALCALLAAEQPYLFAVAAGLNVVLVAGYCVVKGPTMCCPERASSRGVRTSLVVKEESSRWYSNNQTQTVTSRPRMIM